jgi:hypothetical protein
MFNTPGGRPLTSHTVGDKSILSGGGADFFEATEPLPTGVSDVVMVATATSFQPFLSDDKSMVYSELVSMPLEISKDPKNLVTLKNLSSFCNEGALFNFPTVLS